MISLAAISLTPSAREWLSATTTARVLNSFDRACNLINQNNDILALVASERGLTPFAMVVASEERFPFRAVTESSIVRIESRRFSVGPLQITIDTPRLWNPIPDWAAVRQMFADHFELPEALPATALEVSPAGSLLELFLSPERRTASAPMLDRAAQGANKLVAGLHAGSLEQCVAGAKMLAGAGGGLTPAGDDFIVGVLLAAWAGLFGERSEGREQMGQAIAQTAAPLTTTLSAAYLHAAARGECMIHWHDLFAALLASNESAVREALRALTSVGHTSGADALAGFLFVGVKELS
ncbi:MAG: DUF2877 domain-containing protein [Chloroflexi bacterium]|nr:DUF2877 domain-containing protein [Chloroflexota bacterium]